MIDAKERIKYFLYARKSSEREERQVQSIDDQISRLKILAQSLNIEIKEILTEAKSAKKPYIRPVFSEMLNRIEKGEADGILCWQINRLSRNPIDSGILSWMLQQGVIKCIQAIDQRHLPDDNVILFSVESSVANQYIIDLKKNCRRGMEGKADRGWLPSLPPLGYLNDKIDHTIMADPERFELIRKMWDLMLTGNYTPNQIRIIANDTWGFRTFKYKKLGGKELSNSAIYRLFNNIFYTGMFRWSGKLYNGKHKAMITLDEYDRVQEMLGRKGTPRPKKHEFAYTGMIRCTFCGSMITATEKTKLVKATGKLETYTYYHCTRKNKKIPCKNQKPVTLGNLETQIEDELKRFSILPAFLNWALEILTVEKTKMIEDKSKIYQTQQDSIHQYEKELENLTRMRYRDLIDDISFIRERDILRDKILKLQQQLKENNIEPKRRYIELTEKTFRFAAYAHKNFSIGSKQERRSILSSIGSNYLINDKILNIEAFKWLLPIASHIKPLEVEYGRLELANNLDKQSQNTILTSIHSKLRSTIEDVRTEFEKLDPETLNSIKFPHLAA